MKSNLVLTCFAIHQFGMCVSLLNRKLVHFKLRDRMDNQTSYSYSWFYLLYEYLILCQMVFYSLTLLTLLMVEDMVLTWTLNYKLHSVLIQTLPSLSKSCSNKTGLQLLSLLKTCLNLFCLVYAVAV